MPASLSELEQQNPNLRSQLQEWQAQRTRDGENPTDWAAFRQHALALGAPDPGPDAPPEFTPAAAGAVGGAARGVLDRMTGQPPPAGERQEPEPEQQGEEGGGGLVGRLFGNR